MSGEQVLTLNFLRLFCSFFKQNKLAKMGQKFPKFEDNVSQAQKATPENRDLFPEKIAMFPKFRNYIHGFLRRKKYLYYIIHFQLWQH